MEITENRELRMIRTFNAPIDLLWQVLTSPEHIKNWWGPDGFTSTIRKMEVNQGGRWEFTMHGPDGTDYENEFVYREIIPLKKIVLEHLNEPKFTLAIHLFEEAGQTRVEWRNIFETATGLKHAVETFKADEGLKQNLDRLEKYLAKQLND